MLAVLRLGAGSFATVFFVQNDSEDGDCPVDSHGDADVL